jgi:hypothetical protein
MQKAVSFCKVQKHQEALVGQASSEVSPALVKYVELEQQVRKRCDRLCHTVGFESIRGTGGPDIATNIMLHVL